MASNLPTLFRMRRTSRPLQPKLRSAEPHTLVRNDSLHHAQWLVLQSTSQSPQKCRHTQRKGGVKMPFWRVSPSLCQEVHTYEDEITI